MTSVRRARRERARLVAHAERRRARYAHAVATLARLRWLIAELDAEIAGALAELDAE